MKNHPKNNEQDIPLLDAVAAHARSLLRAMTTTVYHNEQHTADTVDACREIGKGLGLSRAALEPVLIAAWFHDTGYGEGKEGHEERSVGIAERFLAEQRYPAELSALVARCIRATRIPQQPTSLQEKILCDADMAHLGKKKFFERSTLLRTEMERHARKPFTEVEWLSMTAAFIAGQSFHTEFARKEYEPMRGRNLIKVQTRLRRAEEADRADAAHRQQKEEKHAGKLEKTPPRGIDTMIRQTANNHIHFSAIADHKASMLISTNSLMMTLIVTLYGRGILGEESIPQFVLVSILVLMSVSLATITFAILSTRPKVTSGRFSHDEVRKGETNLLFFGNFHNMDLAEYEAGMNEVTKDAVSVHGSSIRDIFFLGKVLGKRFRFLRISYNIFMFGLTGTLVMFVMMFLLHAH